MLDSPPNLLTQKPPGIYGNLLDLKSKSTVQSHLFHFLKKSDRKFNEEVNKCNSVNEQIIHRGLANTFHRMQRSENWSFYNDKEKGQSVSVDEMEEMYQILLEQRKAFLLEMMYQITHMENYQTLQEECCRQCDFAEGMIPYSLDDNNMWLLHPTINSTNMYKKLQRILDFGNDEYMWDTETTNENMEFHLQLLEDFFERLLEVPNILQLEENNPDIGTILDECEGHLKSFTAKYGLINVYYGSNEFNILSHIQDSMQTIVLFGIIVDSKKVKKLFMEELFKEDKRLMEEWLEKGTFSLDWNEVNEFPFGKNCCAKQCWCVIIMCIGMIMIYNNVVSCLAGVMNTWLK